jgi:hypothetical protein
MNAMLAARRGRGRLLLTSLLDAPKTSAWIFGAGAAHVALTAAGLGGWPCPFLQATGLPCPGCGLGRASGLLLHGDWLPALRLHVFAPLLLLTLAVLGAGLLLRGRAFEVLHARVQWVEERTPLVPALFGALLMYWALRFALDGPGFRALVS